MATTTIQRHDRTGDSRARELFHYFQPDNPAMLPLSHRTADSKPSPRAISKQSPNLVLTALAQLAAIKVQAQRAIISLIDRETLYVVAEASRSLHLGNTDLHDDFGDDLWMGCSNGPVAGTLCEETITLKPTPEEPHPFFTVKDLKDHPAYCKLPCVAGQPHFRFYAGTPLKTANGVNIGSLYVIDPRPNLALTPSHLEILGTLADTVMEYMETSRNSLEATRLTKVLAGLNTFVQGEPDSDSWSAPVSPSVDFQPLSKSELRDRPPDVSEQSPSETETKQTSVGSPNPTHIDGKAANASAPANRGSLSPRADSPLDRKDRSDRTFQRAATTICQSLDLGSNGGVIIVGASEGVDHDFSEGSDEDKERKVAKVWAIAHSSPELERPPDDLDVSPATQMDSHFVRRMIRCHPRGGLWYFQDDAILSSSDEDGATSENSKSSYPPSPHAWSSSRSFECLREKDLQSLKKFFPNATRIIFSPLWDSLNSHWFGACFCWSSAETRVFSTHVDLGGLFGFGSTLMVEHSRIRSQESAMKKGDFISTISHEMRSPLHGILAANEFLSEHIQSEFGLRLLDTIRACGQTLLDTFEQILDFTKINSFDKASKRPRSPHRTIQQSPDQRLNRPQSFHLWKLVNVVGVIEDAVESVYSGQLMSTNLARGSAWNFDQQGTLACSPEDASYGKVDVVIDVPFREWLFYLDAGALRRVVMNIFGNSLKYTESGSITLHLEMQKSKKGSPLLAITLSDTGKGISHDYLHSKIFTPFSQEDSLSPGTGLGLSLVRDILRSLNGSITIKSQLGRGTVVKIAFPILHPQQLEPREVKCLSSSPSATLSAVVGEVRQRLQGKVAQILYSGSQATVPLSIIGRYVTDWLGMELEARPGSSAPHLIIINEHDLDHLDDSQRQSFLLILCLRRPTLWQKMATANKQLADAVWLTLPCGPQQLARTLHVHFQTHGLKEPTHMPIRSRPKSAIVNGDDPVGYQDAQGRGSYYEAGNDRGVKAVAVSPGPVPISGVRPVTITSTKPKDDEFQVKVADGSLDGKCYPGAGRERDLRVLLVEDNAINLALLCKFISRLHPRILHTAVDGAKAVDLVQNMSDGYHFILMDLSMPVMDGFEATRRIRLIENKRQTTSPAKIIALTGLGSSEHIRRAYTAGVNVFLRKPFTFKDIVGVFEQGTTEV